MVRGRYRRRRLLLGFDRGADPDRGKFLIPFLEGYRLEHRLEEKWLREIPIS